MLLGKFFYIFSHGFKQILTKGLLIFYLGDQKLFRVFVGRRGINSPFFIPVAHEINLKLKNLAN